LTWLEEARSPDAIPQIIWDALAEAEGDEGVRGRKIMKREKTQKG